MFHLIWAWNELLIFTTCFTSLPLVLFDKRMKGQKERVSDSTVQFLPPYVCVTSLWHHRTQWSLLPPCCFPPPACFVHSSATIDVSLCLQRVCMNLTCDFRLFLNESPRWLYLYTAYSQTADGRYPVLLLESINAPLPCEYPSMQHWLT